MNRMEEAFQVIAYLAVLAQRAITKQLSLVAQGKGSDVNTDASECRGIDRQGDCRTIGRKGQIESRIDLLSDYSGSFLPSETEAAPSL